MIEPSTRNAIRRLSLLTSSPSRNRKLVGNHIFFGRQLWTQRAAVKFGEGVIRVPRHKTEEEALIQISATCRAALEAAMAGSHFSAYVFTTAEGEPFSVSKINRAFARAKVLAGIERRGRVEGLRDTFGSKLACGGVTLGNSANAVGPALPG